MKVANQNKLLEDIQSVKNGDLLNDDIEAKWLKEALKQLDQQTQDISEFMVPKSFVKYRTTGL